MNITPFGDRILIKPFEKKTVLVSDQGALSEYGEVIAIGEDVGRHWFWLFRLLGVKRSDGIKVGETYGFSVFGVEKLVVDDQKFYFLRESSDFILGKIEQ